MRLVNGALSVAVSLGMVCAVTAVLWYGKRIGIGPHHPVFCYLLPVALVAILYGSRAALLCAAASLMCVVFFRYDPIYSFRLSGRLQLGDMVCFGLLTLIGVKCADALFRPAAGMSAAKSRLGRP